MDLKFDNNYNNLFMSVIKHIVLINQVLNQDVKHVHHIAEFVRAYLRIDKLSHLINETLPKYGLTLVETCNSFTLNEKNLYLLDIKELSIVNGCLMVLLHIAKKNNKNVFIYLNK